MTQATQASTVPKHSSPRSARVRSGSTCVEDGHHLGGRGVRGDPDALGLEGETGPDGAQVLPADARAERCPGGPPPHDGRGALVGDAHAVDRTTVGQRGPGHGEHGAGHDPGVELDQPGRGRVGQDRRVVDMLDGGVGADDRRPHAGRADVDDEDAPARRRDSASRVTTAAARGEGRPNLPGLRMPIGSKVCFSPASTSKPAPRASGKKRGRFNPMPW